MENASFMMYAIGPSEAAELSREFLFWKRGRKDRTPSNIPNVPIDAFMLPAQMAYNALHHSVTPVNARLLLEG